MSVSVYLRGNPVTLAHAFGGSSPTNPTTVTFTVLAPDGTRTAYVWGTDPEVSNPGLGLFVLALAPPSPPGEYEWRIEGAGAVVETFEDAFTVLESAVLTPVETTVATPGPCSSWISGDDVANCGPDLGLGSETWRLNDVAYAASHVLYELSGRQLPGVCERTVRPCRQTCSCFGFSPSLGLGPWYWTSSFGGLGAWGWRNECGDACGCGTESYVRLAGYPVREILEVKLDGVALDPVLDYRLDDRRRLIRLADLSGPTVVDRFWPACQDLSQPDTEPGTYSVRYTWGADVPLIGRMAAAELARELWNACAGENCRLPKRVTKVVRQGVTYEKIVSTAGLLRSGETGLQLVDAFLATINPSKAKRRSAVFSPDLQPFARQVGQ